MDIKELLGEELFNQVSEKLGDKKLLINDNSYIPREKFNEVNEALKMAKSEIAARDGQLNELKTKATGNEELSKKIEELTNLNTQTKSEYENKIKDLNLNSAIEKALTSNKAKYMDLLTSKVDKSKLVFDNENVVGLDEQISKLKENYKELFGEVKTIGNSPNMSGENPKPGTPEPNSLSDALNQYYNKNN